MVLVTKEDEMANLMDGRCRCPEFKYTERAKADTRPCPVVGHPENNRKPTPLPKPRARTAR